MVTPPRSAAADIFAGLTDGEVVAAVAVEVAGGEREAEPVSRLVVGTRAENSALSQVVGPRVIEPGSRRRAVEHGDLTGVDAGFPGSQVLERRADDEVVDWTSEVQVAVEVAHRESTAEAIALLAWAAAREIALQPDRVVREEQAELAPHDHLYRARGFLSRHADRQVVEAVAVEVAGRHGVAEIVVDLGPVMDALGVLMRRESPQWAPDRQSGHARPTQSRQARHSHPQRRGDLRGFRSPDRHRSRR